MIFNNESLSSRMLSSLIFNYDKSWSKANSINRCNVHLMLRKSTSENSRSRFGQYVIWSPLKGLYKLNFDSSKLSNGNAGLYLYYYP